MTTKEMLMFLKGHGYSLRLLAGQADVSYMKVFRHVSNGGALTDDEKSALWKFARCQPVLDEELTRRAQADKEAME